MPESLKTSTIFVTVGRHTHVYRNPDDMPESVRKKVDRVTNSANSYTILIADRQSKQELVRSAEQRLHRSHKRALADFLMRFRERRRWLEIALVASLSALLWAMATWR